MTFYRFFRRAPPHRSFKHKPANLLERCMHMIGTWMVPRYHHPEAVLIQQRHKSLKNRNK